MSPARRAWLLAAAAWAQSAAAAAPAATSAAAAAPTALGDEDRVSPQRVLGFPRDHGAHPASRIEWWYVTGWLSAAPPNLPLAEIGRDQLFGFQVTFFRSRTGLAVDLTGRLAPRQLLFAHAAVTDVRGRTHRHAQRLGRWDGSGPGAALDDLRVRLAAWHIERLPAHAGGANTTSAVNHASGVNGTGNAPKASAASNTTAEAYAARVAAPEAGFALDLRLQPMQPLLLQGQAGYSAKGPGPHASHYVTHPQLAVQSTLTLNTQVHQLQGRAWLDHEWSDSLMPAGAVGWDWIGINLADGGALTAFVLRAADGRTVWAGGSHRPAGGAVQAFRADQVVFTALRQWISPASGARYPVRWRIATPAGSFELEALLDAQELDSRGSTGSVYWEGLSELLDLGGRRVGLGYLEMTGRAGPLRLG